MERKIRSVVQGFQRSFVLMAANELGIFGALAEGPLPVDRIAGDLKLSLKGAERLLDALAGMEILAKENERYRLMDEWKNYLALDGDNSLRQWIQLNADLAPVWLRLPEFIRSGRQIKNIMDDLKNDPEKMRAFIGAMHDKAVKDARLLARAIPIEEARYMLDLGGGPGTYALEWAKLNPGLRAVVFDIPPVLEAARQYIQRYGLEDRVGVRPGDFLADDMGSGYDLVLLANVVHMYGAENSSALIKKSAAALAPGGLMVIHGFCVDGDGTGPMEDVLFNLNIGMLTDAGRAHPVEEITGWLERAGISRVRHFRIEGHTTGVVTGVKVL